MMLDYDPNLIELPEGHFIGGSTSNDGISRLDVRRPSDRQRYASIPEAGAEVVDRAVRLAATAQLESGWGTCAPRARGEVLRRWAALIEADSLRLSRVEALGSTRPISEVVNGDVLRTADCIRFFAEYADKLGGDVAATASGHLGLVIGEPYGVVAGITPWNFPLSMAAWKAAPALVAGNAVVLKPSELTPFSTVLLAELAHQAGVPAGVFNVVLGTGPVTGEPLVCHPDIGKVSFTGSTVTGRRLMEASSQTGVRAFTLELGGKSPHIVFDDAPNLDRAAGAISQAILFNAGQVCTAGSRLVAHRKIVPELVERIVGHFGAVRPGDTWSAQTNFPAIISERQTARIETILAATRSKGDEVLSGGDRLEAPSGDGVFFKPTIVEARSAASPAVIEEIFGPVLTIQQFEDEEEALALADHPVYGLAAGVHTANLNRAMRCVRTIKAGAVWVNRWGRTADYVIPAGGFKQSGIGKDLGRQAVEATLRHKSVVFDFHEDA